MEDKEKKFCAFMQAKMIVSPYNQNGNCCCVNCTKKECDIECIKSSLRGNCNECVNATRLYNQDRNIR